MKKVVSLTLTLLALFVVSTGSVHAQSFTFGAAGDYANGSNFQATVNQVATSNPAFMIALGDLSYSSGTEQSWCNYWKSRFNNILLIVGNHDSGESSGGNINTFNQYCPYTLNAPMTGKYGKEYYFDYPTGSPLARFILIAPGIRGSGVSDVNTSYTSGSPGYNFVSNAIDDARNRGIKWVIVGHHKNYISAMEKPNELGPDLINMLIAKRVDVILQGHEHGYERSKQLTCARVNSYDASCVADADDNMVKGAGSIIHVIGTGGQGLRGLNTNDSEYPYFAKSDVTTYGFGKFTVSATSLNFQFVRSAGGNFTDSFTISGSGGPVPTPGPTTPPTNPPARTPTAAPQRTATPPPLPCATVPSGAASVTLTANVNTPGQYKIWSRVQSQGSSANSFFMQVDNKCPVVVGDNNNIPTNAWSWIDYANGNVSTKIIYSLTAGTHTFKLFNRENGMRVDSLLVTDLGCVPTGLGGACTGGKIGDINSDGTVNIIDVGILVDYYGQTATNYPPANLNTDNIINIVDVGILIDHYGI